MLWGDGADIPVPGDYDGDGKSDIAVFRPSNGTWYTLLSGGGGSAVLWGDGADIPVPGDYDGDGKSDIAVFRPSNGTWYTFYQVEVDRLCYGATARTSRCRATTTATVSRTSPSSGHPTALGTRCLSGGGGSAVLWGDGADIPVPGDYDGDGKSDIAVFRPSNGTWYTFYSGGGGSAVLWGDGADIPVPGDYDGDGKSDIAVFRPSNGTWYMFVLRWRWIGCAMGRRRGHPDPDASVSRVLQSNGL